MDNLWIIYGYGWWLTYPSEKYESPLGPLFSIIPIYGTRNNVPNHQPDRIGSFQSVHCGPLLGGMSYWWDCKNTHVQDPPSLCSRSPLALMLCRSRLRRLNACTQQLGIKHHPGEDYHESPRLRKSVAIIQS